MFVLVDSTRLCLWKIGQGKINSNILNYLILSSSKKKVRPILYFSFNLCSCILQFITAYNFLKMIKVKSSVSDPSSFLTDPDSTTKKSDQEVTERYYIHNFEKTIFLVIFFLKVALNHLDREKAFVFA